MASTWSPAWNRYPSTYDKRVALRFKTPFYYSDNDPITLVELRMRGFSANIREKPRWWEKVNDSTIVSRWRQEMVEIDKGKVEELWGGEKGFDDGGGQKKWPRDHITDVQLDYIFDELRYAAKQRDKKTGIESTAIPMVYQSTCLIPADIKADLLIGVSVLKDVPMEEKDWHPGTNRQVLDLVHPSLYCLCIDKTPLHTPDNSASSTPLRVPTFEDYIKTRPDLFLDSVFASQQHQWLPTDFEVTGRDNEVRALGYINNLNPLHKGLYATIQAVLQRFIPLFENVIADCLSKPPPPVVDVDPMAWYDHDFHAVEDYHEWPTIPEPTPFAPQLLAERIHVRLSGHTLQIITKLANVELTPENPNYPGGSWHIEGMENEKIVATGIYYYASENITESRLAFRRAVGSGTDDGGRGVIHQQWDYKGYAAAFGLYIAEPLNQELGSIVTTEDKCLVFPNIYQHCVAPFELADPTKPGFRKILCFFLVDPFTKIASTSDVPAQQTEWFVNALEEAQALQRLPQELWDIIVGYAIEDMMSVEEAKKEREKLMQERSNMVHDQSTTVFETSFNMCEH